MAKKRSAPRILVVSDGRGNTATQMLKAGLVQFEDQPYRLKLCAGVRTPDKVREIVDRAARTKATIFYTLVGDDTRQAMSEATMRRLVPAVDLLGPAFSALHDLFKTEPLAQPGLLYASERKNFDLHAAIDYTLKHDDGARAHELSQADVVLVGVSRASKSSTCFYLAYEGIKAANVPLLPDAPPLPQLIKLKPEKVVGLRVNVMRLINVREVRAMNLGLDLDDAYVDKRATAREVTAANRLMEKHGWRSFDASYMAIEEIAREVMRLRNLTGLRLP